MENLHTSIQPLTNNSSRVQCLNCRSSDSNLHAIARDVEYFTTADNFKYYRCNACSVLFIDPVPIDQLGTIYPTNYYSFTSRSKSFAFRLKDSIDGIFFRKILKKLPYKNLKVLDIGGGTGSTLDMLRKNDQRINDTIIVDIDDRAKSAAVKSGHKYFAGKIEEYNSTERFHVILMLNLIEHVNNPQDVMTKVYKLLEPGGAVIIKTPNHDSWDARIFKNKNWVGYHCPRHWVLYDKRSFNELATSKGFAIKDFGYTQGAPFWAQSILHLMHEKKWIQADADHPIIYHTLFAPLSIFFAVFDLLRKPFAPLSQMFYVLEKQE